MKSSFKILLIVSFCFSFISINAQGYLPIFKDVNRWCTRGLCFSHLSYPYDIIYSYSQYNDRTDPTVFIKDTTINSKSYKILRNASFGSIFFRNVDSYVREDTISGKAWYLDSLYNERILYDFSLNLGDSININFTKLFPGYESEISAPVSGSYIVDTTYILNVYGANRKILFLKLNAFTDHLYNRLIWIEGIGSNTLPVYINTPSLNETVYNAADNFFLHNFSPYYYKRATELVVIEKSTGTILIKPFWDCNRKKNINGIKESNLDPTIIINQNLVQISNPEKGNVKVLIQNMEGKTLFDQEFIDSEISIDIAHKFPPGILIFKIIKNDKTAVYKHLIY